jgi:hypothetical protein
MAPITKGNDLDTPVLQPGYVVADDGYQVLTCKAVYKCNHGVAGGAFTRGDSFGPDPRLKAHKISISYGANDIATVTVDYIGLETESAFSLPNVSGSATLTTEPITNHPNFFVAGSSGGIAGPGPYTPSTIVSSLKPYGQPFQGDNGAIFELADGGRFLGFYDNADPVARKLYQKTGYLAPTSTFNGVIYTNTAGNINTFRGYIGKTMNQRGPTGFAYLLPSYYGSAFLSPDEDDQLLIASAHFEDYGAIFKISYELRFNAEGYTHLVYSSTNP